MITSLFGMAGHGLAADDAYVVQLETLAAQGDGEANFALALLYEYGEQGVERNPRTAFAYLQKAGDARVTAACLYLGLKYENGGEAPRDLVAARRWYCRAARDGWAMAQFFLATLYEQGKGGGRDTIQALAWYELAARQGYPGAAEAAARLKQAMSPAEMKKAKELQQGLVEADCPGG